jgi:putative nucleotidyltransferase with HDIG domain
MNVDSFGPTKGQGRFIEFVVEGLIDNSVTDFDLFVAVDGRMVTYASSGYHWHRDEIERLVNSGRRSFWADSNDCDKIALYRRLNDLQLPDGGLAPSTRLSMIEEVGGIFCQCLYESEFTEGLLTKAKEISCALVETLKEDRSCVKSLKNLESFDAYTFYHSIRVASYATAIAIEMGIDSEDKLAQLATGCLLHDVGKKYVGLELLNKKGVLTNHEWTTMREHPLKGYEYLDGSNLSSESLEIVVHHHEKINGSGYPHGLTGDEIIAEVRIACIADIFDALTSSRSYQIKRSRFEALDLMKRHMLNKEISTEPYKALISCLR